MTPGTLSLHATDAIGIRYLHTSPARESATLAAAGVSIAVAAVAARYALRALDSAKAPPSDVSAGSENGKLPSGDSSTSADGAGAEKAPPPPPPPSNSGFFGAQAMARRFYRGGFEDKMTRREAALILGVR